MQRLKALLVTVINTLLSKLKSLAIHIIKHPLGSMWWAVKMYFALMFFSLFVACSFGAFANTIPSPTPGTCEAGTPMPGIGCVTTPKIGAVYTIDYTGKQSGGSSPDEALDNLISNHFTIEGSCASGTGKKSASLNGIPVVGARQGGSQSGYHIGSFKLKITCTYEANNPFVPGGKETINEVSYADHNTVSILEKGGKVCPPDGEQFAGFNSKITVDNTEYCMKPFDVPNGCFSDPKYSIANQYHFAPQDAGKGSVCVDSDNGQLCPWKELPGSNGVFSPDTDSSSNCSDQPPSDPMPPPPEPPECTTTPSGMLVCKEDPNEKCTANSSNAMSCPPSCGYYNNVFVCFENPDVDPEQPEEPDVPRPPADDNIDDPSKPLSDMLKKDFKDVQRGVESRLDGFAADMANLIKAEKSGNDQLVKNSAQGNKLLNSINQNTADTVKELKKINEGTVAGAIETPEFGDKNDWGTRNFGTVLKGKVTELSNLPIIKSATSFFNVTFAGSCPVYNVSVWVFEITIDQFCTAEMQAIFPYIKAVVLLIAALVAFRVAFL